MNIELFFFLLKKHTDTLIGQTKSKPQETLEFKLYTQMEIFSLSPPITISEEGKWLIAVTNFEAMNFVFLTPDGKDSFWIIIRGHWNSESAGKTIDELKRISELRSQNDVE